MANYRFHPDVFSRPDLTAAKRIILTPDGNLTTEQRWEKETAWVMPRLSFPEGLILDYGCGVGRISKLLSQPVLGIDISPTMRAMAPEYVGRDDFAVCHPSVFRAMVDAGMRASGALAFWVLQHVWDPEEEIRLLARAVASGGVLYTINARSTRFLPVKDDKNRFAWLNDGADVHLMLERANFYPHAMTPMPTTVCAEGSEFRTWVRA